MKAAEMVYDENGNPQWDKMWSVYCNLAAEGGPSHRADVDKISFPGNKFTYNDSVKSEILRGLTLLNAKVYKITDIGEIYIDLFFPKKADWFSKIINLENVESKSEDRYLVLPWSGEYKIDKEVKSVVTVWGKASHYWKEHRPMPFKVLIVLFGHDPLLR